MAMFKI